ncbi:MAG: Hsp70 family protein [Propionicimonas sp.]
MKISKAVGIDLGTTNSVIAMVGKDNETIICYTDRSGRKTFPSVVAYDRRSDSLQAGAPAFAKRGTAAEPIVSIKSHMGDADFRAKTGPKSLAPIEVSAVILGEMKKKMQEYLETNGYEEYVVDRAVITIPAYFAANAREATTKAAEKAGLKVEFTLQEPTAAVLYYARQHSIEDGIFLVYDLGGGTFDVSVVKVDGGDADVLGIAGNNYLGGDNLDEELASYLLRDLQNDAEMDYDLAGFDANHDPEDRRRFTKLKLVAESIKKSLSLTHVHFEEFSNIFTDKAGVPVNLALEITRETFEKLIRPILEPTMDEVRTALAKAKEDYQVTLGMVDAVLLVGGSTHIPLVRDILVAHVTDPSLPEHTKQPVPVKYEPDMAVGYGAALSAVVTGTAALNDAALAVLSGDELAIGAIAADELVLAPTFGPGSGYGGESVVEGSLGALQGAIPQAIFARVTRAAGGFSKEYPVNADGSFAFTGLLSENDPEPYACEFLSGRRSLVRVTFDASIRNAPRAQVALSRSYFIETKRVDGGSELVPLMRQGETLPLTRDYEFATNPSNSYFAELRFYEEFDFLKQVTINFPEPVAPGTAVKLSLSCNLQSKFSARASVAGVVVDTQFEASPAPPLPSREDVAKDLREARAKIEQIPETGAQIVQLAKLDRLSNALEAALDAGDAGKARDLRNEVRRLASEISTARVLAPKLGEFEDLVARCERVNGDSDKGGPKVAEEIYAAANSGRNAYKVEDQARLTKAVDELDAILNDLTTKDPGPGGGGERPPLWMLVMHFGPQVIGIIDAAEARTDLPDSFRRDHMLGAAADRSAVRAAMKACTPPLPAYLMPDHWMADEDAASHFSIVQRLYQKWEGIQNMDGVVTKRAGI